MKKVIAIMKNYWMGVLAVLLLVMGVLLLVDKANDISPGCLVIIALGWGVYTLETWKRRRRGKNERFV